LQERGLLQEIPAELEQIFALLDERVADARGLFGDFGWAFAPRGHRTALLIASMR
jgi:hypothetical protein